MLLAVCHSEASGWTRVGNLEDLSELRKESGNLLWAEAEVDNLTQEDVALIAEEFDLHQLAVEDAMTPRQRPKFETYPSHQFLVMHQLDEVDGQLEATQIACFVGRRFVVTIHAGGTRTIDEAKRRWSEENVDRNHPSYLVHTLLDVVVDDYQVIADRLEEETETLEEVVLAVPTARVQRQIYSLKQRLARLRRYVLPGARLMDWVVEQRPEKPFSTETGDLFRDVDDHLLRIKDQIRNIDDLAQAILDLTHAEQATMLNDINRKLAAWAAIFAIGTLIAGVYGMNFELVPEDQSLFGFWFALFLMVGSSLGLYALFKRKGWL
jgi:magnesium transporter